ncbi:MAG: pyridoxal phosphate-dependent aminotransferase [Candidatus Woesearchaeota archaeon]
MILSKKILNINESATLAVSAEAKKLKAKGIKVYDFSAGEPDFPLPEEMLKAGIKALEENFTKYTAVSGILELKQEIARKLKEENNINCNENEIIVCTGGKQALFNAFMTILNPGDEVIIPSPYWVSYSEQVKLCDGLPVLAETKNFQIKADLIAKKITNKTKAIIINSPCNPTGSVIEEEELRKIADIAVTKNIFVISDEIYEKIIYDKKHLSIASLNEEIKKRTIIINGFSKTYGITGLRIGYACANEKIIQGMNSVQSHTTSNACSIAQKIALAALKIPSEKVDLWVTEFKEKRDFVCQKLKEMDIDFVKPEGAFYVFAKVPLNMGSIDFCKKLLQEQQVASVPGVAFGQEGYFRLSYSCSMEDLKAGLLKMENFLNKQ